MIAIILYDEAIKKSPDGDFLDVHKMHITFGFLPCEAVDITQALSLPPFPMIDHYPKIFHAVLLKTFLHLVQTRLNVFH